MTQQSHYYAFGMEMEALASASAPNKYRYNGKELNEDFGLNWSDYGARWYDAAAGRWWSVDPMAEKYVGWSGYNYVMGNPLRFLDPDGMSVDDHYFDSQGKYLGSDGQGTRIRVINKEVSSVQGLYSDASTLSINRKIGEENSVNLSTYIAEEKGKGHRDPYVALAGIANHYAGVAGVKGEVTVGNDERNPGGLAQTIGDKISLTKNPKRTDWYNDYNNLINGLNHEAIHQARREGFVQSTPYEHVAGAFLGQMRHSSFSGTTQQFKIDVFALSVQTLNSAVGTTDSAKLNSLVNDINKIGASYNLSVVNLNDKFYVKSINKQ